MTTHHFQLDKLTRFSIHLEEICSDLTRSGADDLPPPELADEIAVTAGEIMLLLADHGDDLLVCGTLNDARRLRAAARTMQPRLSLLVDAAAALTKDVAEVIQAEKRAA